MPPTKEDGAGVATPQRHLEAKCPTTDTITAASIARPALDGRRRRAARRREAIACGVSLLCPDGQRTWWHYLAPCPVCGRPHLGRSPELAGVTGTRQLPCRHWVSIVVATAYGPVLTGWRDRAGSGDQDDDAVLAAFADGWRCGLEAATERGSTA